MARRTTTPSAAKSQRFGRVLRAAVAVCILALLVLMAFAPRPAGAYQAAVGDDRSGAPSTIQVPRG